MESGNFRIGWYFFSCFYKLLYNCLLQDFKILPSVAMETIQWNSALLEQKCRAKWAPKQTIFLESQNYICIKVVAPLCVGRPEIHRKMLKMRLRCIELIANTPCKWWKLPILKIWNIDPKTDRISPMVTLIHINYYFPLENHTS